MKMRLSLLQFMIFLFAATLISACGSSGGGGGESSVPYTGKTTQAKLTPENSGAIMSDVESFGGGIDDAALPKAGGETLQSLSHRRILDIAQSIRSTVSNQSVSFLGNKAVPINETNAGNCGGQLVITGSVDDETLDFNITAAFDNFCENGTTVSGSMTIKSGDNRLAMTMSALTITDDSSSITMGGTFTLESPSSTKSIMTMDVVIRENTTGATVKLENYRVEVVESFSGETTTLSGRFYSPDHGFIDITTITPFFEANGNNFPSSGVLEIVGSNGTRARLTALNASQFKLEVDADGDGAFESTVTGSWGNLNTAVSQNF